MHQVFQSINFIFGIGQKYEVTHFDKACQTKGITTLKFQNPLKSQV